MNSIEDQVRAATRAEASTLPEVGPLQLPPKSAPRAVVRPLLRGRPGWLAPVAAAAAAVIIALAAALVIIKDGPNGPAVPAVGQAPAAAGLPQYYVTLDAAAATHAAAGSATVKASPTSLLVADTVTGATVATVPPPSGTSFYGVTGAADDRTFVVDTSAKPGVSDVCQPRTLYRLTIAPGASSPTQLSRLPIPALSCIGAIALSGSGDELAVVLLGPGSAPARLRIYSVASGQLLRSWTTGDPSVFDRGADQGTDQNRGLSWIDGDRELAFPTFTLVRGAKVPGHNQWHFTEQETVRTLPVSTGGDLIKDSRVVWSTSFPTTDNYPDGCQWGFDPMVSANGSTVVCPSVDQVAHNGVGGKEIYIWRLAWLAYSVAAPKSAPRAFGSVYVSGRTEPQQLAQLWVSATGSTVIAARGVGYDLEKPAFYGAVSDGVVRSLPVPPGVIFGAPPAIAW